MFAGARARPGTPRGMALGDHHFAELGRSSGTGSGSRAVRTSRWKRQVWQMLEGEFQLLLANPAHIRNVPGKKTGKENRPSRPVR